MKPNPVERLREAQEKAKLRSRPAQRDLAAAAQQQSQFQRDFELVAEHYQLREHGEYEHALDTAKNDKEGAKRCYHAIANSLRGEGLERGITERIQARIAAEQKAAA